MNAEQWPDPPASIQLLLDNLKDVRRTGANQWKARCPNPNHVDEAASFGFKAGDKKPVACNCFGCDDWEGIQEGLSQVGCAPDDLIKTKRPSRARPNSSTSSKAANVIEPPPPLESQDRPLAWHDNLMRGGAYFDFLTTTRGLTPETLEFFKIGTDSERITIPIRFRGKWRNVRRYLPNAPAAQKMRQLDGHGSPALLYPVEVLQGNSLPVLVCEGEFDALLAHQHCGGKFVAVTGTGGASVPPSDLSPLADREVFIAYDVDDAGRKGAEKLAERLRAVRASVHILDLGKLGLPYTEKKGEDVTDYFMKHGGTGEQLFAEMKRLRDDDPDVAEDEVIASVRQMFLQADDQATDHLDDLLSDDQILALKPPSFVVAGWVPRGFFTVLYGEPGVKKTFAILDMLRSVRAGQAWHTHPTQQGATLLYQGEGVEQLQERILSWDAHYPDAILAPGSSLARFVDLTKPEGVAAVIRTVRGFEARENTTVELLAFDPAVEFMTGEEVGEGMELMTKGLRALAQYLNIGVLVGHHTNASGERARGSDHMRMRAGAHIRMEQLENGLVGLVQQKQKNGEKLALVLQPVPLGASLVLQTTEVMTAQAYAGRNASNQREQKIAHKLSESVAARSVKVAQAAELLTNAVRDSPGIVRGKLLGTCKGTGIGNDLLEAALDDLVKEKHITVEVTAERANAPHRHYLSVDAVP